MIIDHGVAPLAGAWIEIVMRSFRQPGGGVAPLAGAWIEIRSTAYTTGPAPVAPLAGAWIEICWRKSERSN